MISIKKILCPVDFFAASDRAVNYAAGHAGHSTQDHKPFGASLL